MKKLIHTIPFATAALALLLLAAFAAAIPALAQTGGGYDLSWFTADDNGGGVSLGGGYALGGTTGQPDAGQLSGGGYTLVGGFWQIKQQYPNAVELQAFCANSPTAGSPGLPPGRLITTGGLFLLAGLLALAGGRLLIKNYSARDK